MKKKPLLEIIDLNVKIGKTKILKNLSLTIENEKEIHVIMGRNGSGKSTLAKAIVGHPNYIIEKGEIFFKDSQEKIKKIKNLEPNEISLNGIFLAFQHPIEIYGIKNIEFLKEIYNQKAEYKHTNKITNISVFEEKIKPLLKQINLDSKFLYRDVNVDFSGGEKKRNELLQLLLLKPQLIILDEIDSGLDIESMELTSKLILNNLTSNNKSSVILISHYTTFIKQFLTENKNIKIIIHIMENGTIKKTGGPELLEKIEKQGFN